MSRKLRLRLETTFTLVRALALGSIAAGMLLWVACFNGYPTVFSDSGGYLWTGKFLVAIAPFRAPGYSIFTKWLSLGKSAWYVVAAQAIIVVYVLREACEYLMDGDRRYAHRLLAAGICILAALTSLPWLVSLMMPDVFAGVLFLSAFLLAFARELPRMRRIVLASTLLIAACAHASLLPIAATFIASIAMARLLGQQPTALTLRSMLAWTLIPLVAAGIYTASLNKKMGLGFRFSASGNSFLLAKLFSNGLAADFLRAHCRNEPFISCRYLGDLPESQEEFLFRHPLAQDLYRHDDETRAIVVGAILAHPLKFAARSGTDALDLLAAIRTGDEIRSYGATEWNSAAIEEVFPQDFPSFLNSRQSRGLLLRSADSAARVDVIFYWLSAAICVLMARGRFGRMNEFFCFAVVFLFINAAICATVGGVYDRYQARVAWLVPFCGISYVCCWAREWQSSVAAYDAARLEV